MKARRRPLVDSRRGPQPAPRTVMQLRAELMQIEAKLEALLERRRVLEERLGNALERAERRAS